MWNTIQVLPAIVASLPYPQTLDLAESSTKDKHSSLLRTFIHYGHKFFTSLASGLKRLALGRLVNLTFRRTTIFYDKGIGTNSSNGKGTMLADFASKG